MPRKKLFYSESQITKNLFTKGKELMYLDDWKEYSGYYHEYSTGEKYTGRDWDPINSKRLIRYKEGTQTYFKYLDLKQFVVLSNGDKRKVLGDNTQFYRYKSPSIVKRKPTSTELNGGVMQRYFIYKRNEKDRVLFEVDVEQASTYGKKHEGVNQFLYGLIAIPWKLSGPEYDEYRDGILVTPGVVDTNRRIVLRHSKKFRILAELLHNYREFSKYDGQFNPRPCINC